MASTAVNGLMDCPHLEVKVYYHGLVMTTEYVLYREVKSIKLLCMTAPYGFMCS